MATTNPVIEQDRAYDLWDLWHRCGYVMFPQQKRIYEQLAHKVKGKTVVEAGCGVGVGSAVLERAATLFMATDISERNLCFAREIYPWINFKAWDIEKEWWGPTVEIVVCVETIEHIANPRKAIQNLIAAATEEVWISTPNGQGKKRPPENPNHVAEYSPREFVSLISEADRTWELIFTCAWNDLDNALDLTSSITADPLVYRIRK